LLQNTAGGRSPFIQFLFEKEIKRPLLGVVGTSSALGNNGPK
jgi:hypothetical protein